MLNGLVTNRDVFKHPWAICRGFGVRVFFRCLQVSLQRRPLTFLEVLQLHRRMK
ncbi:MAG TPA: hypothetical protein VJR29_01585 [bacterium]|nr:hypothetical protein [bacterium]